MKANRWTKAILSILRVYSLSCAAILLCGGEPSARPRLVLRGPALPELQAEASARGWETAQAPDGSSYLAGSISEVLFAASRTPGAWVAALAVGGSPRAAIDTNRIFAANLTLIPVLWIGSADSAAEAQALRTRIPSLEFRPGDTVTVKQAFDWLASHQRESLPPRIDCETGSATFGKCYWAEILRLDPARRNDVLPGSRLAPGSGASLALGGFRYDGAAPGPGVLVSSLPEGYEGPLKPADRIVALAGKPIEDARHYRELLDGVKEPKPAAVLVQRGKERLRIETRIVLPKREETETARLQAEYLPDTHEIQVISRGAAAIRLTVPPHWVPARLNWNGNEAGELSEPGCWEVNETEKATRCRS